MTLADIGLDDWSHFHPREYLAEYYADVGQENLAILRFFAKAFGDVERDSTLLDFGCGPTIFALITAAARFREIHVADYLEQNCEELKKWLNGEQDAWDWTEFVRAAITCEGAIHNSAQAVQDRQQLMRQRVTRVSRCDATRDMPLDTAQEYDVVTSNFCAESATDDLVLWQRILRNIGTLVRPGGRFIVCALKGAEQPYPVGEHFFPAVCIHETDLRQAFVPAGFLEHSISVESISSDGPHRKYQGIMMASAIKSSHTGAATSTRRFE